MFKKIKNIVLAAVAAVSVVSTLATPVQAQGKEQLYKADYQKSTYTKKELRKTTDKIIRLWEKGTFKVHGRLYLVDDCWVIPVLTYADREILWRTLENEHDKVISIEMGKMVNKEGDGITRDGCYIGYRKNGKPMYKKLHQCILTIEAYCDTNMYTDSVVYRKDKVIK